ncbi:RHS repeat-associated core domain-containing protein [Burkholderia cepacia]|uniref:RHS repeat-associated core domain-containing protein n=2 Tax=Burkholderia cepacia TaxID=292 RepID=UPI001FC8D200|nr:RHS repeat-associated core domain-containing protein [Burkholderia cepacia]MDN7895059.1 RHS repeat-associated core domain-containing protein [Burkholderia cepacia]
MERDDLHREVLRTQGKLTSHFGYDAVGRRARHAAQRGHAADDLLAKQWQYDAAGDVIQKRDQRYGTTNYRYDPTGRIEQAAGPGLPSEVFRWDAAANLVSSDHPGGYVEHNRLKMFEDKRFEYDAYGRLVRKVSGHGPAKELILEYDDWNQLKTVVTKDRLGIGTTHFEYDAFGRRIRKLNGSYASTDFLWDGMRLVQETYHDRQGEEALTYLYESNSYVPLARIDQGKPAANDADARDAVYYFHNDVSGLPEELTDAGGDLVWQARYKVWGNAVQEEWVARAPQRSTATWGEVSVVAPTPTHVPRPQNLRFQGQYLDRETGLHYNTFRFYDPDIGRFISPDPIGLMGGFNFYAYAPNSLGRVDPLGLSCGETPRAKPSNSSLASRIRGMLNLYPEVVDPRTGRSIPFPSGIGGKVPVADRVSWGATERGNFIKEWYDRGYSTPRGGWAEYDIHHIQPREFGGNNDFWNLVPVQRKSHQELFNAFWRDFDGL